MNIGQLRIERRFAGPPGSGNGGYVSGRLAAMVPGGAVLGEAVKVTLRQPPPVDASMDVSADDAGGIRATFGGIVIAEAVPSRLDVDPVDPVSAPRAAEAEQSYAGLVAHPFPGCFVCGPERPVPDGLGLRPGPVRDRPGTTATVWRPDPSLAPGGRGEVPAEMVWAALDCPGGWTMDLAGRPAVLGRMTAQIDVLPSVGETCVVMGRALGREGRKSWSATTLYDGDGRVLGRASAVWIDIDRGAARETPLP